MLSKERIFGWRVFGHMSCASRDIYNKHGNEYEIFFGDKEGLDFL